MAYAIKPLTAELSETFAAYLEGLDFGHAPHWASCFCRYYYTDCDTNEWIARSALTNRAEALTQINAGNMKGYLAFDGETCIGWCNANDVQKLPRLTKDLEAFVGGKKVGCAICFVVHPQYRGQGVARQLLRRAIDDFKQNGYVGVIALPFEDGQLPQKRYRGTVNMYAEAGFVQLQTQGAVSVMWLDL